MFDALLKTLLPRLARPRARQARLSNADAIDLLYSELRELMAPAREEVNVEEKIQLRFRQLRELQAIEADAIQKRFEMSRWLDPARGWKALEEAREMLGDEATAVIDEPARS